MSISIAINPDGSLTIDYPGQSVEELLFHLQLASSIVGDMIIKKNRGETEFDDEAQKEMDEELDKIWESLSATKKKKLNSETK